MNKGLDYTYNLVKSDNPEWLNQQMQKAQNLAVTKETETPADWCKAAQQSLSQAPQEQQYWLWIALLTMKSLQDQSGVTQAHLEVAKQMFDDFLKGKPYKNKTYTITTVAGLVFELRNAYMNL